MTARVGAALVFVIALLLIFPLVPNALRWPARVVTLAACAYVMIALGRGLRRVRWSAKGIVFSGVLLLLMFGATHLLCLIFMRVMGARDDRLALRGEVALSMEGRQSITELVAGEAEDGGFHPRIGWLPRASRKTYATINEHRFRATREYAITPPDRDKRVLCMGDSFTLGVGVGDDQTYPHHAEQLLTGTEWLNFGIAGGCLTQAYLHYIENARKFDGKYVIIGFMTNDAQRTVNCYRPFLNPTSGMAMTKPFAFIDNRGQFAIKPNPYNSLTDYQRLLENEVPELRKLLGQDYLTWGRTGRHVLQESPITRTLSFACDELKVPGKLQDLLDNKVPVRSLFRSLKAFAVSDLYGDEIWAEDSKGFLAVCGMFDLFHSTVVKDGRVPIILIIPGPNDVHDFTKGDPRKYETLIRFLEKRHYRYLDFLDTLLAKHRDDLSEQALFVVRHYQGHVNRELAGKIVEMIK